MNRKRMELSGSDVRTLIWMAQIRHKSEIEVKTAVLLAWAALAGRVRWTAAMVDAVEREMAR